MKLKHLVFVLLVLVAVLFLFHNWQSHGGVGGIKQGLGFPGGRSQGMGGLS